MNENIQSRILYSDKLLLRVKIAEYIVVIALFNVVFIFHVSTHRSSSLFNSCTVVNRTYLAPI